jgi:Phage portal protein
MGRLLKFARRFEAIDPEIIRRVEPLEGTRMSLWNSQIPQFWQDTFGTPWYGNAALADRVWVANRCQQLNAQQIAGMPIEFHGPPAGGPEPEWLADTPDPNWYPNGIGDALFAIVSQLYGWGFCCLYVTTRYADGFPRNWTVLDSGAIEIKMVDGARAYKLGDTPLNPARVVQIDRNPGVGVKGTSALHAFAQQAWGLLAAGNKSLAVSSDSIPQALLKKKGRPPTDEQATAIQERWMASAASRGGAPAVIGENIDYEQLSFNPSDLALLETQEWNARVIADAYGVPAVLLNMSLQGGLTYQNPAALGEMWWRFELRPTATRIADAISNRMLPRGQWIFFDAADTFAAIGPGSSEDDPQRAADAAAPSQAQPDLTVIGGTQ